MSLPSRLPSASSGNGYCFTVDRCWLGGWRDNTLIAVDNGGFRLATDEDPAPEGRIEGTVLPGFRDSHVHLGLIDGTRLLGGGIAGVDDFGWDLETARGWLHHEGLPQVTIAGQLITAPGGYPTQSEWAPEGAACEIASSDDAAGAVDRQREAGAGFIKVALNSDVGPVLDDATLKAIVGHAHSRKMRVAAHAQGAGQAERAFDAGVDRLAHAPWTQRLPDILIAAMAKAMSWVSTLDIHGWGRFNADFAVANDNVRRFHAAGGDIRYGTDLGNGPMPLGINHRELLAFEHAGLELDALVTTIARPSAKARFGAHLSFIKSDNRDELADWLGSACLISPDTIKEFLK